MEIYQINDRQIEVLYQVKTALQATSLIGEYASEGCNKEVTPLIEIFAHLAARMGKVLGEVELLPDAVPATESMRVV